MAIKLTERVEKEERDSALDSEKEDDLFFAMLNGKDIEESVDSARGAFVVKYPQQKDLIRIARLESYYRNGITQQSFSPEADYEIKKCAFLDVVITGGPDWYSGKKTKNKDFSWRDMPDAKFVDTIFAAALSFREKVQGLLEKATESGGARDSPEAQGSVSEAVASNLFQGVSSKAG